MGLKIKKIEHLDVVEPSYDIAVESNNHTVELDNGVIVHNSLKAPKQFFGFTDDAAGFDGGTSLSLLSSRYAKTIRRIQNTFMQALTDALNLMLIDKGMSSYVNKFNLHMVPPTTREELDRQDSAQTKISIANDIMMLVGDIKDLSSRLQILKALIANAVNDPEVIDIIQDEIDRLEKLKADGIELDENGDPIITEDPTGLTGDLDFDSSDTTDMPDFSTPDTTSTTPDTSDSESNDLPSPDSLGIDFTDNDQ